MDKHIACVLIPTINAASMLKQALSTLEKQTYVGKYEVWVIDSQSTDNTQEIAEAHGAKWILDTSTSRADACNRGISEIHQAHSEEEVVVLFTDDDALLPPDWIENHMRWYGRKEVSGIGGQNWAPDDDPWTAKCSDVVIGARWITLGTRYGKAPKGELVEISHNPGVNASYRLSALLSVNGFEDGSIGAEDVELDSKLRSSGHRLWFDPTIRVGHRRRRTRKFAKQMRNYGKVRRILNSRDPDLASVSHQLILFFPILCYLSAFTIGGSLLLKYLETSVPYQHIIRTISIGFGVLIGVYILLCWVGSAFGKSPQRRISTIIVAPFFAFIAHFNYGMGIKDGNSHIKRHGDKAGFGHHIDDRVRSVIKHEEE